MRELRVAAKTRQDRDIPNCLKFMQLQKTSPSLLLPILAIALWIAQTLNFPLINQQITAAGIRPAN